VPHQVELTRSEFCSELQHHMNCRIQDHARLSGEWVGIVELKTTTNIFGESNQVNFKSFVEIHFCSLSTQDVVIEEFKLMTNGLADTPCKIARIISQLPSSAWFVRDKWLYESNKRISRGIADQISYPPTLKEVQDLISTDLSRKTPIPDTFINSEEEELWFQHNKVDVYPKRHAPRAYVMVTLEDVFAHIVSKLRATLI